MKNLHSQVVEKLLQREAQPRRRSMFPRLLWRAAILRRGRTTSALVAMIVAATAATAMLNLSIDVHAKLEREFRNYGANIVVVAKDGQALPSDALRTAETVVAGHERGLVVPFGYVVARTPTGQPVVVGGTEFEQVHKLNQWWDVSQWPQEPQQALVGARAINAVSPSGQPFDLSFQGHTIHLTPSGTVKTGAAEDSRIYISFADFKTWTGLQPSTLEIAAYGSPEQIIATTQKLAQSLPTAEVKPIRQIMEGEARVLRKTHSTLLYSSVLIIATAALCVLATLIGWVFDRRRDFAIMKALGASEKLINAFFAAEAGLLGLIGACIGYVLGVGIAAWIGRANFHAPVVPRIGVLPPVLIGSVLVALIAAIVPISLLHRVQPANILRGE